MNASGMRRGILLLVVAFTVTACSTTSPTTTTAPPATIVTTTPPTTSAITSTTTTTTAVTTTTVDPLARPDVLISNVNRDSIDDFDTSKDNVYEAAMELRDLFVFLEGNPTDDASDMVSLMFERDYLHWNPILIGFRELTDNPGWHYSDPGVHTLGISVVDVSGSQAVIRIADHRPEQVISDGSGSVVKTYQGWERRVSEFTLNRQTDGRWRYADARPSEPITNEELASMVPVEWTGRTS